jgi:DNA-nicking Smr family endonuclease
MLSWFRRWRAARAARAAVGHESGDGNTGAEGNRDGDDGITRERPALTDELDLHTFLPGECADIVEEYVRAAQEAGLAAVRIIHGKGKGALRRTVHAVLARHPAVRSYRLAEAHRGSWGATLVELKPP